MRHKHRDAIAALVVVAALLTACGSSAGAAASMQKCVPAPGADLSHCNFTNKNLAGKNLRAANFTSANLTGANLTCELTGANLTGAIMTKSTIARTKLGGRHPDERAVRRRQGTPASLPRDWQLVKGYLVGPGANLKGAQLQECGARRREPQPVPR